MAFLPRPPLKLRTRITASFVLVLSVWGLILAASLGYILLDSSHRFYRERGVHLIRALAAQCGPLVYYEDWTGLDSLFQSQMKSIPDLRYIAVVDPAGVPIWSTFAAGFPADLLAVPHDPPSATAVSWRLVQLSGERVVDYQVEKGRFVLRMGMSLAPVEHLSRRVALYGACIGLGGLLAVLIIALYISRPLEALSSTIERAVLLDRKTGGPEAFQGTLETSKIGKHFQDLMDRLEERTRQLDAAKKLAYLGEVSATIAHEINNPLGVLAINSEFLGERAQAGHLDPEAVEEVERLQIASKRATLAVQKFLQFARYTTKGGEMRLRPTALQTVVRECAQLLEDRLRLGRLTLRTEISPNLPRVMCDEQGLQQVLFNLLTNAVDASPEGGEITVQVALDGPELTLQVSDRGQGMTPEALRHAPEPFFTTKEQGLGLGLAISNTIVLAHGGALTLENRPGGGVLASVRIPVQTL
ncbi:MAG: hypothetical protein HYY13_05750 [Nitrospirae bacterium]|nr:hypothetical protein [Nitrospirota bacterium]